MHRTYNIGGLEPLLPGWYNDFVNAAMLTPLGTDQSVFQARGFPPIMSLASARWIIADRPHPSLASLTPKADWGRYRIFENPEAFPRAFFVKRTVQMTDRLETLRFMLTSHKLLRDLAILDAKLEPLEFEVPPRAPEEVKRLPDEIIYGLPPTSKPSFLVLTDSYATGWKALADGKSVPIYRTNWWMRGILIPPGSRTLVLRYRPPGLTTGSGITAAGVLLMLVSLLFNTRPIRATSGR